jgi:putative ABC transport system permease protein
MRLALGADHPAVLRLVVSEGAALVALGVLIGIPGVYAAGRIIQDVLVGVSPSDAETLLAVAAALAAVTMAASYLPARRVLRIEPWQTLRQEGMVTLRS